MARYWVSGANSVPITAASVSSAEHLLGASITSGRVLWLTSVILPTVTLLSVTTMINIYDAASGSSMTASANKRMSFMPLTTSEGIARSELVELPMPGMKFSTGCVVLSESTAIPVGDMGGCGYEV